jgi:NAD(P)-dependent dehydrogenase (short-subunit alcohol dehydrogenase family)
MSLVNQTAWVVGGVGVVGRGITRGLLQAGATVIVNSRSPERLEIIKEGLGNPERLITIHGSLLPGYASKTVADTLANSPPLNHVVAHGAVRWWARQTPGTYDYYEFKPGCDESYSLNIKANEKLLDMTAEQFAQSSAQLASLHFSAAQQLMPRLEESALATGTPSTYTFVTGDGSGKPGGERTSMGEINSHHVWGLSAALRREYGLSKVVAVREVRVGLPINPAGEKDTENNRTYAVSEAVGDLCAGLAAGGLAENGRLLKLEQFADLDKSLAAFNVAVDHRVGELPSYMCGQGELSGSL